jgi:hypothetical protein
MFLGATSDSLLEIFRTMGVTCRVPHRFSEGEFGMYLNNHAM